MLGRLMSSPGAEVWMITGRVGAGSPNRSKAKRKEQMRYFQLLGRFGSPPSHGDQGVQEEMTDVDEEETSDRDVGDPMFRNSLYESAQF